LGFTPYFQLNKKIGGLQSNMTRLHQLNTETGNRLTFLLQQLNPEIPFSERKLNVATKTDLDYTWDLSVILWTTGVTSVIIFIMKRRTDGRLD
jgi:hypothetical protein